MASSEGIRRVRLAGKAMLGIGLVLDAFLVIGYGIAGIWGERDGIFAMGFFGIPLTVLGAVILALAWIAEGFVSDERRARGRTP